jgi:hypothetical protein
VTDEISSAPYGELVRHVLAGQIEPEAAALEAVDLMRSQKGDQPTALSLSFLGLSEAEAERLARFASAMEEEQVRRLASGPDPT